jgi:hypothetical protein
MSFVLLRAGLVAGVLSGVTTVACGGAVDASSTRDGVNEDAGAGGAGGEPAAGGRRGAGGARGGNGGSSSGGASSGGATSSGGGACQITEPGRPMTPEDCLACVGEDTGCVDFIDHAFTAQACASMVPDVLIDCLWYPDCSPDVWFSPSVVCPSPTGCTLCYVNF